MSQKYKFPAISVFCGASHYATTLDENKGHIDAIENFGKILAENKIPLVWGAGETGMMGAVSRSILDHGGKAIGVSTHHLLYGREGCQLGVTMLLVADDMQARKLAFAKLSCAFTIFPGGAGTGDELFEYLLEREYNQHTKPLVLVNFGGYFDLFLEEIEFAVAQGDIPRDVADMIFVVADETEILPRLADYFKKYSWHDVVPTDVDADEIREGFGADLHLGPPGPEDARTVTLQDTMIPLDLIGPRKLAKSVMVWCGAQNSGLENPERVKLVGDIKKLLKELKDKEYRIVHSGQNTGMKGYVSDYILTHEMNSIAVTTRFRVDSGYIADGLPSLLVRRNEQSVDFALKALSSAFVICPGGVDVREKFFEFLTEVDIQEHDKPVILWNYKGYFDKLLAHLDHLFERGYMNERALSKVHVVQTVDEIIEVVENKVDPYLSR